jgi:hypothetical protein
MSTRVDAWERGEDSPPSAMLSGDGHNYLIQWVVTILTLLALISRGQQPDEWHRSCFYKVFVVVFLNEVQREPVS